jgi:hypothetical protein
MTDRVPVLPGPAAATASCGMVQTGAFARVESTVLQW